MAACDETRQSLFQLGKVVIDGRLQDGVRCVEVAVSEPISHPGHFSPRYLRFGIQQGRRQLLHGLADLNQPNPDGIEDQPIGQSPTLQVCANRLDGDSDVLQPLLVTTGSQPDRLGVRLTGDVRLEVARGHDVYTNAEYASKLMFEAS